MSASDHREPAVSVIILTWNGADLLRGSLQALREQTFRDFEIIIIDNGSTDHTPVTLNAFPEAQVLRFDRNIGFAAGVNAGIRRAHGSRIALLNNDAYPRPDWLATLVTALDADEKLGSCAAKILQLHRPDLIDAAGDQIGIFASQIGHGMPDGPRFQQSYPVLSACAGAALYRRVALEDIGLFEERFFAYLEDVDVGVRLQLAGYKCQFIPDAVVLHQGSATASRIAGFKYRLLMRNSLFLFFQYMPLRRMIWSPVVLAWPVLCALAERQPLRLVAQVYSEFLHGLPDVLRTRRIWRKRRVISDREFIRLLAHPMTIQAKPNRKRHT